MEHDALIELGLDDDGAIARIAQAPTLLDAWEASEEPSDMIWIATRTCLRNDHVQLVGLTAMTLAGNMIGEDQTNLKKIHRQVFSCLHDPKQNIVENIVIAMNAALIDGEKHGIQIVGEGEEAMICFEAKHHNHMFMWQSLRAVSLLYVEEFAQAAKHIQIGWSLLEPSFRPTVVTYLKSGIDYEKWFADWVNDNAIGNA